MKKTSSPARHGRRAPDLPSQYDLINYAKAAFGLRDLEVDEADGFARLFLDDAGDLNLLEALNANPLFSAGLPGDPALGTEPFATPRARLGLRDVVAISATGDPLLHGEEAEFARMAATPEADGLIKSLGRNPLFARGLPGDEAIQFEESPGLLNMVSEGNTGESRVRVALATSHAAVGVGENRLNLSAPWTDVGACGDARRLVPVSFEPCGEGEFCEDAVFDELLVLVFNGEVEVGAAAERQKMAGGPRHGISLLRLTAPVGEALPAISMRSIGPRASGIIVGSACSPWKLTDDGVVAHGPRTMSTSSEVSLQLDTIPVGFESLAFANGLPKIAERHAHVPSVRAGQIDMRRIRPLDGNSRHLDVRMIIFPGRQVGGQSPICVCHPDQELLAALLGTTVITAIPECGGIEGAPVTVEQLRKANPGLKPHRAILRVEGAQGNQFSPYVATLDSDESHCVSAFGFEDSVCLHVLHTAKPMNHITRREKEILQAADNRQAAAGGGR